MKIHESHPYWHVRRLIQGRADIAALSFSIYIYTPQQIDDERRILAMSRDEFLEEDNVAHFMYSLTMSEELALNSTLIMSSGEARHLVMVDMATAAKAHLHKLQKFLDDSFFDRITWFDSGRSFHGYGGDFLTYSDWVKFMGLLLLVNRPRLEPTVDPRWIGHRLLAGYSALRWTKNTAHYLATPRAMKNRAFEASFNVGPLGKTFSGRK